METHFRVHFSQSDDVCNLRPRPNSPPPLNSQIALLCLVPVFHSMGGFTSLYGRLSVSGWEILRLWMGDFASLDRRFHISGFYKGLVWAESTDWCENVHQGEPHTPPQTLAAKLTFSKGLAQLKGFCLTVGPSEATPSPVGRFGNLSGSFQPSKDRLLRPTVGLKVTDRTWQLKPSLSTVLKDLKYLSTVSPPLSSWPLTSEDHMPTAS